MATYTDTSTPAISAMNTPPQNKAPVADVPVMGQQVGQKLAAGLVKPAPAVVSPAVARNSIAKMQVSVADQNAAVLAQKDVNATKQAEIDKKATDDADAKATAAMVKAATAPDTNGNAGQAPEGYGYVGGQLIKLNPDGSVPEAADTSIVNPDGTPNLKTQAGVDAYRAKLEGDLTQSTNDLQARLDKLSSGAMPLDSNQQLLLDQTKAIFQQAHEAQLLANKNFEGGVTQAGISSGLQRYSPIVAMGQVQTAINSGIAKVAALDAQNAKVLSEMNSAMRKDNWAVAQALFDDQLKLTSQKNEVMGKMLESAQSHLDKVQEQDRLARKDEQERQDTTVKNIIADVYQDVLMKPEDRNQTLASYAKQYGLDPTVLSSKLNEYDKNEQKDAFKQTMESDKWNWQQKQDIIANKLASDKFTYQQKQDAREYALKVEAARRADTPVSHREWTLAGSPGTYQGWLLKKDFKPPTADESKNAGFAMRMKESDNIIQNLTSYFKDLSLPGQAFQNALPSFLQETQQQQLVQAKSDFLNAILRRDSGAAISPSEFSTGDKQYFPQPGDSDEVLKQKADNRRTTLQGVVKSAGVGLSDDFRKAVDDNKTTYSSTSQYKELHPEEWGTFEKFIKDNGITNEADALKVLNK
jgi:hypothetical protein